MILIVKKILSEQSNYEVDDIFKINKMIDEKFSLDYCDVIKKFIKNETIDDGLDRYKKLVYIRNFIDKNDLYNIMISGNNKIENIIHKLQNIDKEIYDEYSLYNNSFDLLDFINYVDIEISKVDPTIYVFVGQRNVDYHYLDDRIKTIYDEKIYKGIKIIYHNKVYDYSLG